MHGTHQIGIKIHEEVGTTLEKGWSVIKGPLGAILSLEGIMCGISHTLGRSCMTCMPIMDLKEGITQIQRGVKNEYYNLLRNPLEWG